MKSFLFILLLVFSFSLTAQNNEKDGRKRKKPQQREGGFIQCIFVCQEHGKNCTFLAGHHEIIAYEYLPDNPKGKRKGKEIGRYEGGFLNSRYHGQGHEINNTLDFEGQFNYGYPKKGILKLPSGDVLNGEFKARGDKWYFYEGDITSYSWFTLGDEPDEKGNKTGLGDNMYLKSHLNKGKLDGKTFFEITSGDYNGTTFDGYFKEGKIDGCGIMQIERKDNYLQPSANNNNDGYLAFKSLNPSGDVYYGQFQNGSYNGWGVLYSKTNQVQFGYWNNDNLLIDYSVYEVIHNINEVCDFNEGWEKIIIGSLDTTNMNVIIDTINSNYNSNFGNMVGVGVQPSVDFDYGTPDDHGNRDDNIKLICKLDYLKANVPGDYTPGRYEFQESKNAQLLLNVIDSAFTFIREKYFEQTKNELIDENSTVKIKILATTDATKIRRPIDYQPTDTIAFPSQIIDSSALIFTKNLNGFIPTKINIKNQQIKYNSQLAYLRALGIKNYFSDNIYIPTNDIIYELRIDTTAKYRTVGVEILIDNSKSKKNKAIKEIKKAEVDIPQIAEANTNTKAIIIYIDNYLNGLSNDGMIYAKDDADLLSKYFNQTLGIPNNNIHTYKNENASIYEINKLFSESIPQWAQEGYTNFIVYYQGHGFATQNGSLYLIPQDAERDGTGEIMLQKNGMTIDSLSGYFNKSSKIIKDSTQTNVNFICIFDACASYQATKFVGRVKKPQSNNLTIIAASEKFDVARYDKLIGHSLLSYAFCLALSEYKITDDNNNNELSIDEIFLSVQKYVKNRSKSLGNNKYEQIPTKAGNGNWTKDILNTNLIKKELK